MKVLRTVQEMRAWSFEQRCAGRSIGFVPTMGALHPGHRSLMEAARRDTDTVVLSIFVNPAQFAPHEDYDAYPRTWDEDSAMAQDVGVDAIYLPDRRAMYPEGYSTYVTVEGVSEGLCSEARPHFFRGVATVVAKLFNAVLPDKAYFGQKDAQQCAVIKRMARDLDMGIEIVEMPIVRDEDGLAMSSRNAYLTAPDRQRARCLSRALKQAQNMLHAGARDTEAIIAAVRGIMSEVDIDYAVLVDAQTMRPVNRIEGEVLLAVAAQVGRARLIDNIKFNPAKESAVAG